MVIGEETTVSNGQGFEAWLMTEKGLSEKWARNVEWYIRGLLVRENAPFPTKTDAEDLALKVPKRGLLQIRTKWLRKAGFLAQVSTLLVGRCRLTTDEKGGVVSIEES